MAKKRLTSNQKEYRRQVDLLRRRMNRAIKEGFVFEQEQYNLLTMPNRVTKKAIENLKKQNRKLWNISQPAVDRSSGIVYPNIREARAAEALSERIKEIRVNRANISRERSEFVIASFRAELSSLRDWTAYVTNGDTRLEFLRNLDAIEDMVNKSIASQGAEAVAKALEGVSEELGTQEFVSYENVRTIANTFAWCRSFLNNLFPDEEIVNDMLEAEGIFSFENSDIESVEDSDLGI